jgi:hypothetical protein
MKPVRLSLLLLLALSSAACAQGRGPTSPSAALTQKQIAALATSLGPTNSSHLVQNSAECAPDAAAIVWGPNQEALGYSCYAAPQGGS